MAVVPGASVCISSFHKSIFVNIFQIKNVSLKCFTTSCFQKRLTKSCPSVKILCFSLSLNCVFLYCPVYSVQVCVGCFLRLLTVQFWLCATVQVNIEKYWKGKQALFQLHFSLFLLVYDEFMISQFSILIFFSIIHVLHILLYFFSKKINFIKISAILRVLNDRTYLHRSWLMCSPIMTNKSTTIFEVIDNNFSSTIS